MRENDRRTFLRAAGIASALGVAGSVAAQETTTEGTTEQETTTRQETTTEPETTPAEETTPAQTGEQGLVTVSSDANFEDTVDRITDAIDESENLEALTTIEHAENAADADLDLRPTTVVVFGNPMAGTQLMQASQSAGIDLPQKMLVWEAEDGSVNVTYNDPTWLADRHGIEGQSELLGQLSTTLEALATGQPLTTTTTEEEN